MDVLRTDLRFAARVLRKSPGFSAIAIATLALGIGATTAIFSIVDHVLLRPLGYRQPERLYVVHEVVPKFSHIAPLIPVNASHFEEWRRSVGSFEHLALVGGLTLNLTGVGEPERIPAARCSPSLFQMLGVQPMLGRTFRADEDQEGRDDVVVLGHDLWTRRFGASSAVLGRKIVLDGRPFEVVGVLPDTFRFPKLSQLYAMTVAEERPQIWKPMAIRRGELSAMGDFNYIGIAALQPGVTRERALAELNAAQARIASRAPGKVELLAELVPLHDQVTGRSRAGLHLLLAAVAAVLLIGCVNIANLLLARGTGRMHEIAIRSAVGATRGRLARQVLVESLLLSGLGGLAGAAVAYAVLGVLAANAPVDLPRLEEVRVDARILGFTLAVSVLSGLLFGTLPAWRFARTEPQDAMKLSGTRTAGVPGARLRNALVCAEVALGATCLAVGGLLLHSFVNLLKVDGGFRAERVVTVDLNLPPARYPDVESRASFLRAAVEQVSALPGVEAAGVSNQLPLGGEGGNNLIAAEGTAPPAMERPLADIRNVNPEYFQTMGIPLARGRTFAEADADHPVAVVSQLVADRLWPGQDAVGRRFRMGGDNESPLILVTGVVGDVRGIDLSRPPTMTVYVPYWQRSRGEASLVARTAAGPGEIAAAIRRILRRLDPEMPVPASRTMDDIVAESVAPRRFQTTIVLVFGASAVLLASLGIYGLVAYSVAQRVRELGIRMALGAMPGSLRQMVVRQALVPVAGGLALGVAGSVAAGRLIGGLLFGVSPLDPATVATVVAVLGTVAAVAGYVPARAATRVDPVTALRCD